MDAPAPDLMGPDENVYFTQSVIDDTSNSEICAQVSFSKKHGEDNEASILSSQTRKRGEDRNRHRRAKTDIFSAESSLERNSRLNIVGD